MKLKESPFVNQKKRTPVLFIARAAIVAALYTVVTYAIQSVAFGAIQFRVSEALTVLPFFMPEAIFGLFAGCVLANLFSPHFVLLDVLFGGGATLIAAYLSYKCKSKWLVPLPPVLLNAVGVGFVIALSSADTQGFWAMFAISALQVGISEAVVCFGLGIPLIMLLEKIFPKRQ